MRRTRKGRGMGGRIARARQEMSPPLQQKELAARVGVKPGYMCDIEKNRTVPSLRVAVRLARELPAIPTPEIMQWAMADQVDPEDAALVGVTSTPASNTGPIGVFEGEIEAAVTR